MIFTGNMSDSHFDKLVRHKSWVSFNPKTRIIGISVIQPYIILEEYQKGIYQ